MTKNHPTEDETDAPATLEASLRTATTAEVRFGDGDRALYATDASNYRQVPIGVVIPRTVEDLCRTIEVCGAFGAPILPRGGGTSLAGQTCNVAVVIDCSKYLRQVLEVDADAQVARVQPGVVLDDLQAAASPHGLMFGPDPSTHDRCTLGGMLGNDSCGIHSVMAGRTEANVRSLDVLTADGERMTLGPTSDREFDRIVSGGGRTAEIYRRLRDLRDRYAAAIREGFPRIPRRVSGYNLPALLPEEGFDLARAVVGSEGTCVTILEATVRLIPAPRARSLLVLGYPDIYAAADDVPMIMSHGPIGLEGIDQELAEDMRKKGLHPDELELMPDGSAWLLVEVAGDSKVEADAVAEQIRHHLERDSASRPAAELYTDPARETKVWEIRESGLGATARVPGQGDTWPGWEDSAVAPEELGRYLRELRALYDRYGYDAALYGHLGQGCVHTRIDFDLVTAEGIARFRSFVEEAADLVVRHGGSLSGEHGDGQARGELLERMYGKELVDAFREFRSIWDPDGRMNPGKVVDAAPLDSHLRLGTDYRPQPVDTVFAYPQDGSFARATTRCVGVGKCRRTDGGVMCPSFMVTHEERDSTRGRARLLFEMLEGDPLERGWREDAVRDALDLCLSCKGCRSDCPVSVDMATYKAEFLHHHYAGRIRPRSAYALGLIPWTARVASRMPGLANRLVQGRATGAALKALGGIARDRSVPSFAAEPFGAWFRRRRPEPSARTRGRVVLWPDTFNDAWHPETAKAAVEVLERAGYGVVLPPSRVCCGRPLYDFGMLDLAKRLLRRDLRILRPALERGTPIVGLEPSCVAVFRDELLNLYPNDPDARRLSGQTLTLSELLVEHTPGWEPPRVEGRVLVQPHCHHHAVMGFETDRELLGRTGAEVEVLDAGCCGMAGAFGFEASHYDVSVAAGERALLPAIRRASDALLIADGFSCREQIAQGTGRRARHLAEVLAGATTRSDDVRPA